MLVFIHDRCSIFSLVTSQIIKSTKGKVVIIQLQASGKSIISMHVSKILFLWSGCVFDWFRYWTCAILHPKVAYCPNRSNSFQIVRISYFKVWFRWELLLPTPECDDSCGRQCNIALQCNSGCSAVQGKAMPEKKERKKWDATNARWPFLSCAL